MSTKGTIEGHSFDTSKRNRGESERQYLARIFGGTKEEAGEWLKAYNSSSGDSDVNMSSDAKKAMSQLSSEAQKFILDSDFGNKLTSGEVKKFNGVWINSGKTNSSTIEDLGVSKLPDGSFQSKPLLKPGTPEYEKAMNNLSTAYFDIMQQQINASTEQEKSAADYNWNTLKNNIEKTLNVSLSDNAYQAWGQIESLKTSNAQRGLGNSGIQNESIDDYLSNIRRTDAANRETTADDKDANQREYYMKFATTDQIRDLVNSDPEKAKAWGLIPSNEIKESFSFANMKARYPNMTDEAINQKIASVLDSNGNYRSSLYQKYMTGSNVGANLGSMGVGVKDQYGNLIAQTVNPSDSGYQDIQQAKQQYLDINTPLADQKADYDEKVASGAIQPTVGASQAGGADTTTFNSVVPKNETKIEEEPIKPDPNAKTVGGMLSGAI